MYFQGMAGLARVVAPGIRRRVTQRGDRRTKSPEHRWEVMTFSQGLRSAWRRRCPGDSPSWSFGKDPL